MNKTTIIILVIGAVILAVAIGLVLAGGPMALMGRVMGAGTPSNLDMSTTRLTDQGLFQVTYTSEADPVPVNKIHTWNIQVQDASGEPVEGAVITIDGGMPQHGHGLPTSPQVTQNLGDGNYLVEGFKFHMPGWWEVRFHITAGGQSDSVTFNLDL